MKKKVTITVIVLFLGVFAFLFFIPHPAISYNKELFIENKSYYDDVVKMCKENIIKKVSEQIQSFFHLQMMVSLYTAMIIKNIIL
ncbi:MAG: hypothetical protein UE295_03055 [Acutalibacteraceae bacterium]|nr:hypothetical protein [Acutalibacteraceae bacterium]